MADARIPHEVIYEVPESAAISDVIDSLRATEQLFFEVAPVIEHLLPGIEIGGIRVHVESISQGSPLREVFFATLFVTFQADLELEVPLLLDELTGMGRCHSPSVARAASDGGLSADQDRGNLRQDEDKRRRDLNVAPRTGRLYGAVPVPSNQAPLKVLYSDAL